MIKKIFRQMLVPQILSAMTVMICMVLDSIMIGRFLGVNAMTAYGLATPILLAFAAFGSILSAGIQVVCGKAMGSADKDGVDACFSTSVFLTASFAALGMVLVLALRNPISTLLGAGAASPDNPVFFLTRDYMTGFIVGAPAFLFSQISVPYMQLSGNRTRLVVGLGTMMITNILFNALNVFVFHGGTFGMGLASSLSYYVAFGIVLAYFFKKDCLFRFRMALVRLKRIVELAKATTPTVINQVSMVFLIYALNNILLSVGKNEAVAAYSVITSIGNLCYCVGGGIGSVALLLSSIFYGDQDTVSLQKLVKTMSYYAVLLNLILTGAVLAAAPYLVGLFLADSPAAKAMAAWGVRLFSLSLLPSSLNTAFKNYFQGIGRVRITEIVSFLQNFALTALFAFLFSRFWGTSGVWSAYLAGEILTFLVICVIVLSYNKKFSFTAHSFSFLPPDFGADERDTFEATVRRAEDVTDAVKSADEFCRRHGEDEETIATVSLCIREMVGNVIRYGFETDRKDPLAEIRLILRGQMRQIRIRDNCKSFDPVRYLELHKADADNVGHGILTVMKTVKSASYVNTLGLNNLTLIL